MKLIELLATAVTARRVNTPAPGFINEQGGYWADQSSDQSVQRPQAPQPPQTQPPHSTQAPQIENLQCCRDIKWTNLDGSVTWMKHNGQQFDDLPVYEMTWNDEQTFMWWQHVDVPDNRPQIAVPGYWVISTEVGGSDGISGNEGYRKCPNAPGNGFPEGVTFECANPPPQIQSCIEKNRQSNYIFLDQGIPDEFANIMVCRVAQLFDELVSIQFQQLLATQAPETYGSLNQAFYGMVNEWRDLSGQRKCGFKNPSNVDPNEWHGVVTNCGTACLDIKEINEPGDFSGILSTFSLFVVDNFDVCKYSMNFLIWQVLKFFIYKHFSAALNQEPTERDECGRRLSKLFRHVAVFEDIVGQIGGLPSWGKSRLK